ncbi:MAG: hypothetical protein HYU30_04420 [Chloroflexi bacterium]|nr:hypothetical protein [Chloroflexota bacterium]
MEFLVRPVRNQPDVAEVRYDCACGCKPRARYHKGVDEANHEHCCCGRVHFVGMNAGQRLQAYLTERRAQGEDAGIAYSLHATAVQAPWGDSIPVAYALPDAPKAH